LRPVTNARGDSYCYSHTDCYCDCDIYSNPNADTNPYSDALHACGSGSTKRNECDFQQLYRELE
jgi:hypothetical protein